MYFNFFAPFFFFSNFKNKTANFIYTRITSYICSDVVLCLQRNPLCYITNKLVAVMRFKVILPPKRSGHFVSIALIRIKLNLSSDNTKVYLILQLIETQITWWSSDRQLIFSFLVDRIEILKVDPSCVLDRTGSFSFIYLKINQIRFEFR